MSNTWLEYIANGEAYAAENFLIGVAGQFAHLQLFNPVGSGKRVRLRSVHATGVPAQFGGVSRHDTPLITLGLPATFVIENLLAGGPVGFAQMRSVSSVATIGSLFWQLNAPGSSPAIYPPGGREWGFDLLEGQGILVQGALGGTSIVNWMWVEVNL